jgi:tetratricopeptide (TPR) repeat protein
MRYLCVHCNEAFDYEGQGRARCPKCMRVHDIRPYDEVNVATPAARTRWAWIAPLVIFLFAAGGGAFWWVTAHRSAAGSTEAVSLEPLGRSALLGHLKRMKINAGELSDLLQASDEVERFAKAVASNKPSDAKKARALVETIRDRASKRAFVRWSLLDPRTTPPMVPARVLEAIGKDGTEMRLYPLEVVALAVAALRSVGVPAMIAEAYGFGGDRSPPDPSGRIGYFVLAVLGQKGTAPELLDPYGGRAVAPQAKDVEVLTDLQAVGAALSLRALALTARQEEPQKAIADSDAALVLWPRSATVRSARGAIVLSSGGVEQGYAEFQAAAQIRPDAPRHHNLAILMLMKGEVEQAQREVASALAEYRDYTEAHATLASLHIARSEFELARVELEEANRLEPGVPMLQAVWAQYYAGQGRTNEAIAHAENSVKASPRDPQMHLLLAQLYYQAVRYDDMRREARAALNLVPLSQKEEARRGIEQMLGSTALEEPSRPETEVTDSNARGQKMRKESTTTPGSPLHLLPETTKLRLRDSDLKLKLQP